MKIATVTLNPAIDQTVLVDNLHPNAVNSGQMMQFDPGGKGVNVASYLADAGYRVSVTGFLGAENPRMFEQMFSRKGIDDYFVRIPGRTRTNIKIVDEARQETTDINMRGSSPPPAAINALYDIIEQLAQSHDWFVLAGNLPPGVPTTIWAMLVGRIKSHGRCVVLDTSREALQEGVLACPTIVKPNIHELSQWAGRPLRQEQEIIDTARQLLGLGIELVVISMGEAGALFVNNQEVVRAVPPRILVKSTVGAGDAMVAGVVSGRVQGLDLSQSAKLATTFSLGAISGVGAHLPDAHTLQAFAEQVLVQKVVA